MSTHETALSFHQFTLSTRSGVKDRAVRIVLLPGELLRVPKTRRELRVISGQAWVSHLGHDHVLSSGEVLPLARSRHDALISAENDTLLLEIA